MTGELVRVSLRCDELAPRVAREVLRQVPDLSWVLGDLVLVVSELVTNAVQHSSCSDDDFLTICVHRDADQLRVAVRDPGGTGKIAHLEDRPMERGGMGLKVVDAIAEEWGSECDRYGHRVWAKLALSA